MFTGIIEGVGRVAALEARGGDVRLRIDVGNLPWSNQGAEACSSAKASRSMVSA